MLYEAVISVHTEDERGAVDIPVLALFATPIVSFPVLSI